MSRYTVSHADAATTGTFRTVGSIQYTSTTRFKIYDMTFGFPDAPVDSGATWLVQRWATGAGTDTAVVVAQPLDKADGAATTLTEEDYTAEPTYTAAEKLLTIPMNTRATYRWVAAPGSEMVASAIATTGIGTQIKATSYTGAANMTTMFFE